MNERKPFRFGVIHDRAWGWHFGVHFCISPKELDGNREIYLFICLGKHDFIIGFLHF